MRTALGTLALAAVLALAPTASIARKGVIAATGTVLQLGPAANAWVIQSDDGAMYEPTRLAGKFRQDGLRISFRAKPAAKHRPVVSGARAVTLTHIAALPEAVPLPRTTPPRIPPSR